jgi:recombinational DNA repair protein RecT
MQTCASQGLYPDSGLGYMYLIPRAKEVTAQRGYQGDMKLARNTGEVMIAPPEVVYRKDRYKVTKGLNPNIEHVPYGSDDDDNEDDDPGPLRAVYAVAKLIKTGEVVFVTLNKRDVMRHKASSTSAGRSDSPWNKHEAAMWKKTAIHELFKWIPKDSEALEKVAAAIASGMDPRVIDTTGIDLGKVEVPIAGEVGSALDQVAAALESSAAPEAPACDHPQIKPSDVAGGKSATCPDCKGEVRDPDAPAERQPGEDDDEPNPTQAVQAIAAAAGDPTKAPDKPRPPRQGRLQE